MVRQIREALSEYKGKKEAIDRRHAELCQINKRNCSVERLEEIMPGIERRYLEEVNELKAQARARVAYELQKVERWVNFMVQDINPESLNELKAIEGMNFTDTERNAIIARYAGDHFAMRKLSEMFNKDLPEMDKIQYAPPEEFLNAAKELWGEANCIIDTYGANGEGFSASVGDVRVQLAERTLADFENKFTNSYFSEYMLDRNAPLTPAEEKEVATIFAGIAPNMSYQMEYRAKKATEQGKGGLIARSKYTKFLKDYDAEGVEISALYEKFISSSTFESGAVIQEENTEPDIAHLLGMGAENAQEADREDSKVLKESPEDAAERIKKEIYGEIAAR